MGKPTRRKSAPVPDEEQRAGIDYNDAPPLVAPIPRHAAPLADLAASVGLPAETLDALSRKGKGPPIFKLGRRIYCRVGDFFAWLDDVATGKIDATLHPSKRRRLGIVQRDARPRGEHRPAGAP
jgi:hypothetical protein